ncbi:MAG: cadherin-like domain-containing protein, partial [Pseudomonadota bacterium]
MVAGAGNDKVYGGSGADEIKGDAGDDLIDGGADIDTAVYAGAKTDYNISFDTLSGNYSISAKAGGAAATDGMDTLVDVEFAEFADASTWSLGTGGVVSQSVVTPPVLPGTNQPGTLFLSGIGGQGQILTAKVSDADGVAANAVTYSWQANGVSLGATGSTFTVGAAQVGQDITVTASYTDLLGHAELLASAPKTIAASGNGDFAITLLNLKAPLGASVMNPLTTLVENAIELGVSPNEASLIIKKALGISAAVDLQHFDSWAVLQVNPADAAALAVEKKLVQVAVLTSLGSDESGVALTQAILLANSSNKTLNLASTTVIGNILGMDPASALVHEIWDRNDTIASAKTVGSSTAVDQINTIWNDMQSGLSVTLSDSISTLSIHINQAPIGSANAALAGGAVGTDVVVSVSDLLSGFSDPEGSALSVSDLAADHGSVVAGAGFFAITPDAGYSGPMELIYQVMDDQGLAAVATQLFVVKAPSNVINGTAGNDKLTGTAADEVLNGFAGKDVLDGKAGMDSMAGGDGSDTYYLRNVGDVAIETNSAASGGMDKVYSYLASHTLGSNIENGRIMTSAAASLTGNELKNILYAGTGNNQLDGGSLAAADVDTASYLYGVKGLAGIHADLSLTGAQSTGGSGTDTLINIENLIGSNNKDMLTGNSLANSLSGAAGQDSLNGGEGADRLSGGLDADTFIYTAVTDTGLTGL